MASWLANLDEDWVSDTSSCRSSPTSPISPSSLSSTLCVQQNSSLVPSLQLKSRIPRPIHSNDSTAFLRTKDYGLAMEERSHAKVPHKNVADIGKPQQTNNFSGTLEATGALSDGSKDPDQMPPSPASTVATQDSAATQIRYCHGPVAGEIATRGVLNAIEQPNENSQPFVESLEYSEDSDLKKKILAVVTTGGQLQDLFSPMNLEKLFKPLPTFKKSKDLERNTLSETPQGNKISGGFFSKQEGIQTPVVDGEHCDTNETLPLATSTVRGSSKENSRLKWKPSLSHHRKSGTGNTSMVSQDSNENFSPIYLTKESSASGGHAPLNRLSPLKIHSSPNNTADLELLQRRKLELHSPNTEDIPDDSIMPMRKSAKRTSMGNAKVQSPGTIPQDHHSFGLLVADSSQISSSSPVFDERMPKRRRLSNSGKPNNSSTSNGDAECAEISPSGSGESEGIGNHLRKCSLDMHSENEELLKHRLLRTSIQAGAIPETIGKDDGIAIMSTCKLFPKDQTTSFRTAGSIPIKTIPPSSVSHILPKQIGQMTFDDSRLMWVKNQQSALHSRESKLAGSVPLENEDGFSDDDPLRDISDLSGGDVMPSGPGYRALESPVKLSGRPHQASSKGREEAKPEDSTLLSEFTSRSNRKCMLRDEQVGSPSQKTSLDQTPPMSGNTLSYNPKDGSDVTKLVTVQSETKDDSLVSSLSDGDNVDDQCEARQADIRVLDASVPLVQLPYEDDYSGIQEQSNYDYSDALGFKHDFSSVLRRVNQLDDSTLPPETPSLSSMLGLAGHRTSSLKSTDTSRIHETPIQRLRTPSLRYQSGGSYNRRHTFLKPIVSSIHEESGQSLNQAHELEISLLHRDNLNSRHPFSSPFKPDKLKEIRSEQPLLSIRKSQEVSFFNSPLPELSYHYLDAESAMHLEISYVAKHRGDTTHQRAITSFSAATNNLVKNLTDIEPYEPYWEYTRQLRLVKKGLITLHPLNEFCPRIEDLNVHGNELGQVTGVPTTVRELDISDNCLSSLTTWGHLLNLQYLNISRNGLDSLAGLKHLVHLRELRADGNKITDIKDVLHLDGLLFLSARRNRIKKLDLNGAYLKRLNVLDLKENEMDEISNLHLLSGLSELNLDHNRLVSLGFKNGETLNSLRTLKMNKNHLEFLDIAVIPNIRVLYLDDNRLKLVENLSVAKHLDSFSIRQQNLDASLIPLDHLQEVRKLYITGNHLSDLSIRQDFPNLQYLELDFARLTSLPDNFGVMMSNVRVLNLNYNAISDLRPLYGIMRLKKLSLAGNRLNSLKKIASMLKYFPTLRELDLRHNPLTIGFYSQVPHVEGVQGTTSDDCQGESIRRADEFFRSKMDMRTAIQRRCYEVVVGEHCPKLSKLDDLKFSVEETLRKDALWEKMEDLGIVGSNTG